MKRIILISIYIVTVFFNIHLIKAASIGISLSNAHGPDSLPLVLAKNHSDLVAASLMHEALLKFSEHRLPDNIQEWESYRKKIKNEILKKTGVLIDHSLPLNLREFDVIKMKGYSIKNIAFQTLPGVYATANLFVPEGKGPFPAVINLHAHSGRFDDKDQAVGHSLAASGYVCLSIDPWGAGERTTVHGVTEYHGANLGASFMNIGMSLMGVQISDNMRGVDLLCSLPYVDAGNIGAAGASGGGNQTMWLAAADERIKAAVPVVSVGTFESYVMRSNCICELLIDGLTFTEEAGVLALARAIMPCNHNKDSNPTFFSSEMLRSYNNAKPVFKMIGKEDNISCRMFDLPHGFLTEDREAMLGWFDLHLKNSGTGAAKKEIPFSLLTEEDLMVYPKGKRDPDVLTTSLYCRKIGNELRTDYLNNKTFNIEQKKSELASILRINELTGLKKAHQYSAMEGWDRFALETTDNRLIPVLHLRPVDKRNGYVVICNPMGKHTISPEIINEYKNKGTGIVLVDLMGTGEVMSAMDRTSNRAYTLHTLSRAELWLGKTILGEWVKDLSLVIEFMNSDLSPQKIIFDGSREAGMAGLLLAAYEGGVEEVILRDAPVSYLFDSRESIDFFSMAIHLPGFLNWGDVSLVAALTGKNITFIGPATMSGNPVKGSGLKEYMTEFETVRNACRLPGKTVFN